MPEEKVPMMYQHLESVYQAMSDNQVDNKWTGSTVALFAELGIPLPYYGPIIGALKSMGCIVQVRRGGGGSPSIWTLYKSPTREAWDVAKYRPTPRANAVQAVAQRMDAMERRLQGLDIAKALADLQSQIDDLKGGNGDRTRDPAGAA